MTNKEDAKKQAQAFPPSGKSFQEKERILENIRARVITNERAFAGLLTFIKHEVVKDNHPWNASQVAWTDGDKMYFADRYFSQDIPILCGILLHETFHVIFRHVIKGRGRIGHLYNIACDALINDSIGYKQDFSNSSSNLSSRYAYLDKEHCVSLDSLFEEVNIPQEDRHPLGHWTSESLYKLLLDKLKKDLEEEVKKQEQEKQGQGQDQGQGQEGEGEGEEGQAGQGGGSGNEDSNNQSQSSGSSSGRNGASGGKSSNKSNSELERLEQEIEDLMNRLRKKHKMFAGDDMVEGEPKDPTVEQMESAIWTERFNRAKSQGDGTAGVLGKVVPDVYKSVTPWEKQLRKFLVKRCMPCRETSYVRPNRRMSALTAGYGNNKIYIPGVLPKKGIDKIVVIVDTSGSCFNNEEQNMFAVEIDAVQTATNSEVYLIYADTEVTAEYKINPQEGQTLRDKLNSGVIKAQGGGGTDMTIPILYAKEKYHPLLTIIATDGYTPFPSPKDLKGGGSLIWVVNTDATIPKQVGNVVRIHPV